MKRRVLLLIGEVGNSFFIKLLVFYLNDWDGYAVREAALLKEEPI